MFGGSLLPDLTLRPREESDERFLLELFSATRAPDFAALGLPEAVLQQMLTMQFRAQASGYAAQFPHADDFLIWRGDQPIGRLLVNRASDAMHLVDVALLDTFRGQGIGTRLLLELIAEADAGELPLRLFVRADSPAKRLYERLGFAATGSDGLNIAMERLPRGGTPQPYPAATAGRS